jgi:anti-anti-sigma regulatory factor
MTEVISNKDSSLHESSLDQRLAEMNFHFRRSDPLGILIISGDMTTGREADLREALMIVSYHIGHLFVYFEKLVDPEDSLIHLLCSAYRFCFNSSKKMTLIGEQSEMLRKLVRDYGLRNVSECLPECGGRCLWS